MFGIDFSEILVICVIALVVLGPERLPKLASTIGRWMGRARAMARQFREQLEQETNRLQESVDLKAHPPSQARADARGPPAASDSAAASAADSTSGAAAGADGTAAAAASSGNAAHYGNSAGAADSAAAASVAPPTPVSEAPWVSERPTPAPPAAEPARPPQHEPASPPAQGHERGS